LTATVQPDRRVVLDWSDVENADAYPVYERRTAGRVTTVTQSTRTSSPLAPGDYFYAVSAVVDGVESQRSAEVKVTVLPEGSTQPPTTDAGSEPDEPVAQPTRVWDYEDGKLLPPWSEVHALRSDQYRVTTENPYPGTTASAEFNVRRGDTGWNGTVGTLRSEVRTTIAESGSPGEGTDQWWAWPTFFPADFNWDERGQGLIFTQFHQTSNSGQPNIHFWSDVNEDLRLDVRGGTGGRTSGDAQFARSYNLGDLALGEWNDFMVHIVWSSDPDVGRVEVWHQGDLVHSANDATLYVGQSAYVKQGIYSAAGTYRQHFVKHGPLRLGDSRAAVENLPPLD
ncbi:heparin lyase I family protein, partial [Blastococcus atacamensis]|uniref:heparin lyase I family protein n=1 Tax=Blastococcus atacamensis TaxID=2070508 RepID=UPI0012FFF115